MRYYLPIALLLVLLMFIHPFVSAARDECPHGSRDAIGEQRPVRDELKIATFNAYWLFDTLRNPVPWENDEQVAFHISNVSTAVTALNAQFVNLVEVEGCRVLRRLAEHVNQRQAEACSGDEGCDDGGPFESFLLEGTDTATWQDVGFLAQSQVIRPLQALERTKLTATYPVREEGFESRCGYHPSRNSTTGVSKHYIARFTYADMDFLVVGLHLLAIPNDPMRCSKSEGQAIVIRDKVRELVQEYYSSNTTRSTPLNVIVLGDFNDYDETAVDDNRNIPNSQVLKIIRDSGHLDLINAASLIKGNRRYSHWWDKNNNGVIEQEELSSLDHILVSRHMTPAITEVAYENHLYEKGDLMISDHWPVSIRIDVQQLRAIVLGDGDDGNDDGGDGDTAHPPIVFIIIILIGIVDFICIAIITIAAIIKRRGEVDIKP